MANKKKSLFIIDDDITNNELLKKYITEKFDFNIISFTSSDEAVRNIHARPDIVILDYNMDRINSNSVSGLEIMKQILHRNSKTYIILIAGQDKIEMVRDAFRYGAYDYVIKNPSGFVHIEHILKQIKKTIRYKHLLKLYQKLFFALLGVVIVAIVIYIVYMKDKH